MGILFGCHQKENKNSPSTHINNCANYQKTITELINRTDSPLVVSQRLRKEYLQAPPDCQLLTYTLVFRKLFLTAYINSENDPNEEILHFLINQGEGNNDQIKIKLRGLLNTVTYLIFIKHDPDEAYKYLEKVKSYKNELNDTLTETYESYMAQYMLQKGNTKDAIIHFLNAIKIAEKLKDSSNIITNYGNLAVVYSEMGDELKAIPIMRKNVEYFRNNKNEDFLFIGLVALSNSYTNIGNIDSAVYCAGKALELIKDGIKNQGVELLLYINTGRLYVILGDYNVAKYYFNLAKLTLAKSGSDREKMIYEIYSGPAFALESNMVQEVQKIKKYIDYFYEKKDYANVRDGWESLYRIAVIKGNYSDAFQYYLQLDSTKNLLSNKNNSEFISELQTKFETQKKEATILSQQKEIAKKKSFINLLAVLLFAALLGAAAIITRNRLKRNVRRSNIQRKFTKRLLEKTEDESGRIVKDLKEILNPKLSALKKKAVNGENIEPKELDNVINEIRVISRNIHPVMLDQIGLSKSIQHVCDYLMSKELIFITAEIGDLPQLTPEQDLQIFRIIQTIIKNILKHADALAAKIKLYKDGKKFIILEVEDNGKGFNVSETFKNSSAFDLLDIIERSKALQGKGSFTSSEKGTIVTIRIPVLLNNHTQKK
ncbi:MAG: hypothetical protein ABI208_02180 [Ginsengibacter sp.]